MEMPPALLQKLQAAQHVVIFTGAGVSAESGIPTFRDKLTGLWERFRAEDLATPQAFKRDPALVWGWYEWRRAKVLSAEPNPAHHAIAALAELVPRLTLVTQNVDDLHERAGSREAVHLHGTLLQPYCMHCKEPYAIGAAPVSEPPACNACAGLVRPGVVWFGESLPAHEWQTALAASRDCDVFVSVGTSAVVYPAAGLILAARSAGATTVQVNPNETELNGEMSFNLKGPAGVVLPELVSQISR